LPPAPPWRQFTAESDDRHMLSALLRLVAVAVERRQGILDRERRRHREDHARDTEQDRAGKEAEHDQDRMHARGAAEHDRTDNLIDR
jgi:hypothetical protein